jgi:hypothetical protein
LGDCSGNQITNIKFPGNHAEDWRSPFGQRLIFRAWAIAPATILPTLNFPEIVVNTDVPRSGSGWFFVLGRLFRQPIANIKFPGNRREYWRSRLGQRLTFRAWAIAPATRLPTSNF